MLNLPEQLLVCLTNLQQVLSARHETVATAESCTGGLIATLLTHQAGSSRVYLGGVSAYANEVKTALLGVDPQDLARVGAVSAEVAEAMALGAIGRLGATYAVSVTGIAGPDGGRPGKPVGTVFCGIAGPRGVRVVRFDLQGDRAAIRNQAAERALAELSREVMS